MSARLLRSLALGFIVSLAAGGSVQAQGRGGFGFDFGVNPLAVVGSEAVQKELKLSDEQADKLTDFVADYRDELNEQRQNSGFDFGEIRRLEGAEREKRMAEFRAKMEEISKTINAKYMPKLNAILKPEQQKRLREIAVQAAGAAALNDAEVKKTLAITKEQEEKLAAISKESGEKMRELFRGDGDAAARFAKMGELREEATKNSMAVLNKEQQEKLSGLKGKEFDVKQLMQRRGGRGKSN